MSQECEFDGGDDTGLLCLGFSLTALYFRIKRRFLQRLPAFTRVISGHCRREDQLIVPIPARSSPNTLIPEFAGAQFGSSHLRVRGLWPYLQRSFWHPPPQSARNYTPQWKTEFLVVFMAGFHSLRGTVIMALFLRQENPQSLF